MTGDELRAWRVASSLSRDDAARLARVSVRAWQSWEHGQRDVPEWLPVVIRAAAVERAARAVLAARIGTVTRTRLGELPVPCALVRVPELDDLARALR